MNKEIQCCVVQCERPLDQQYWNNQYIANTTGWDLKEVSPPIKAFFENYKNKDAKILIPGCGNAYEAAYLLQNGFTNITLIDIAPLLVENLNEKYKNNNNIQVILGDFFEHQNKYDVIVEQTFFCALAPTQRQAYVKQMHQLLNDNGLLVGLLFNRTFETGPPFGGNKQEYENLFKEAFQFNKMENCLNSVGPREGTELWFEFQKINDIVVTTYNFKGITCNECVMEILNKFNKIEGVKNISVSTNFASFLIVSIFEVPLTTLQSLIAYDQKYSIEKNN